MEKNLKNNTNTEVKVEVENYAFLNLGQVAGQLEKDIHSLLDQALYVMLDFAPGSFYWKDLIGRYLGCNQYMLEMNGFKSRSEIVGKTDYDCVWSAQADRVRASDKLVMTTGQTIQIEESAVMHGKLRTFITRKAPLRGANNEIIGIIGNSIEITDYKQVLEGKIFAEKVSIIEKDKREAVTSFAGSVAHDMKNVVHMYGLLNEMEAIDLARIEANGGVMTPEMTQRFRDRAVKRDENSDTLTIHFDYSNLSIQQIASDNPQPTFFKKDVAKLLHRVLNDQQLRALDEGKMEMQVKDEAEIWMDHLGFHSIMSNLINNALREVEEKKRGKVYLTGFWADKKDHSKGYIFEVKDTAGGVTQELVDRIFELYKTKEVKGTGIGLQSAMQYTKLLGGQLTAHLVDGDCIAFRVTFWEPKEGMIKVE